MDNTYEKQLKEVIHMIKRHNYSLPILQDLCKIYNINPQDLKPKPIEDFIDKKNCPEVQELRHKHFQSRRKSQLSFLASKILDLKLKPSQIKTQTLSQVYFPTTLTPRSSTHQKSADFYFFTPRHLKQFESSKKKLSKALKFLSNLETVQSSDNLKKSEILIKSKKKLMRIQEEKLLQEEMRQKKNEILNEKREKLLKKKQEEQEKQEKEALISGSKSTQSNNSKKKFTFSYFSELRKFDE
jgi:hypothetical protein